MFGSSPPPENRPPLPAGQGRRSRLALLVTPVLCLLLWLGLPAAAAAAWPLPSWSNRGGTAAAPPAPLTATAPSGRLQEVPPPQAVQQLQQALAGHQPGVTITAPRDGALLEAGPWELKVSVQDWPLVQAGTLGLGPHLVVQIDDQPPRRLTAADAPRHDGEVVLQVPPLSPGSHRITAYAARPWGEAVKSPGALQQIRVHRLVANPQALPAPGSVQLLPVSPAELSQGEPVLLDWILLDAPLQNLRPGDGSWRLRVSVNGDSFLVDQNVPLWLKGWRPGDNSLLLELVDGRGEPLNPPFNSLVRAVTLSRPGTGPVVAPRWLQGPLSDQELAQLLGQQLPPEPEPDTEPDREQTAEPVSEKNPEPASDAEEVPQPEPDQDQEQEPADQTSKPQAHRDLAPDQPEQQPEEEQTPEQEQPVEPEPTAMAAQPLPLPAPTSERVSTSTTLEGSARELVNPDGSLIQPRPDGPLAGLRQRFTP
ncbi:MAG: hypothetical protein RLZZ336_1183 [Cyanobacteriota bacterium]